MKQRRTDRVLLGMSVGSFLLMSVSFLLMPMEALDVIPGLMFWLGLIFGVALQIVLEVRRRAFFKAYKVRRQKMQKPHVGLLTFGSGRLALIVDSIAGLSLLATVLAFILSKGYGQVCYFLLTVTVFSFCLHCIVNGRIYFHAKNQLKVRQVLEQKKANTLDKGEGENEKK